MATVTGVSGNYSTPIDYVDTTYTIDGAVIVVSASATASIEQIDLTVRGGSIQWTDCGTWASWPNNRWSPGIVPQLAVTSSAAPSITRSSGTLDPQITLTVNTTGSAIFGPTVASDIVTTTDAQGNVTFSGASSADIVFTVDAEGGKLLHGVADPQLTLTTVVVGERRPGGTATAQLTLTTVAAGVIRVVGTASADLVLTASAEGTMVFQGNATAPLVLTTTLTGGLVQKPSQPATTYAVPSETRIYTLGLDSARTFTIANGETRVYKVLHDTRTATVPSETRIQPTEVY